MDFKKIEISDINIIQQFLSKQPYITCDYTILGLYMWIEFFQYKFAIENDVLYLCETVNGTTKYFVPVSKSISVSECIKKLICENNASGSKTILCAVPEILIQPLQSEFTLSASPNRDWADYLYDAQALLSLSGKKYSKKRNLIHQFTNLYNYRIETISIENIDVVIRFLEQEDNDMELTELARYENRETIKVLKHYDKFKNLYGYLLYVDDKIVGFEICECMNDVCFVHIEKASRNYKGAHQYIFWRAINEIYQRQKFSYINREEDVGDPGLRQAKLSYYPSELLIKYDVEISYADC